MERTLRKARLCFRLVVLPRWPLFVVFAMSMSIGICITMEVNDSISESIKERIHKGQSIISTKVHETEDQVMYTVDSTIRDR